MKREEKKDGFEALYINRACRVSHENVLNVYNPTVISGLFQFDLFNI